MPERGGEAQLQRKVFPCVVEAPFYYIPDRHIISRKKYQEELPCWPLTPLWSYCTCNKRHIASLKCFILFILFFILHQCIFPERHHGDAYILSLRLPTLFKCIYFTLQCEILWKGEEEQNQRKC